MRKTLLVFLSLCCMATALQAQIDFITTGGGVANANGSIDCTFGQAVCTYSVDADYFAGQGVQQPFTVAPPVDTTAIYDTVRGFVCQKSVFEMGDFHLTGDSTALSGVRYFYRRYVADMGRDSIVVLELTVYPSYNNRQVMSACDSLLWNGVVYAASTDINDADVTAYGCDSISTLQVIINHTTYSTENAYIESSFDWRGNTYTLPGSYSDTIFGGNANGCDSVLTLNLIQVDGFAPIIYCFNHRLLMVDHYPGGEGTERVDYAAYRWYRNNQLISGAEADNYFDYRNAQYQPLAGCFFVEVPYDDNRDYWLRSNEICLYSSKGVESVDFVVYPNPAAAYTTVTVELSETFETGTLTVYDVQGRTLCELSPQAYTVQLPVNFSAGTYTIQLRTPDGGSNVKKLIVK